MHTKMVIQSLGCCPSKRNINFVSGAHNIKRGLFLKFQCFFFFGPIKNSLQVLLGYSVSDTLIPWKIRAKHVNSTEFWDDSQSDALYDKTSRLVKYVFLQPEECAIFFFLRFV